MYRYSLLLLAPASALAATSDGSTPAINAQSFDPSMDSHEFFRVIDSDLGKRGFTGRALGSYTLAPLQYTYWDGTNVDIVSSILQLDAMGSYTAGPFRIGVDVPIILRAFGGTEADASGLGDLALDAKVRMLDAKKAPIGLALSARTAFPTATTAGALASGNVGFDATLSADKPIGKRVEAAIDVGFSYQPEVELENMTWGSTLNLQAGLAYRATDRLGFVGELYTSGVLADFSNEKARPTELLFGGWYRMGPNRAWSIRPALAFGTNDAVTTPAFRALFGLAYDPMGPPDKDKDGIADDKDRCPEVPEDVDAYEDGDGCPEHAQVTVRVNDSDGVPVENATWTTTGTSGRSGVPVELVGGTYTFVAENSSVPAEVPGGGSLTVQVVVPAPRGTLNVVIVDAKGSPVPGALWSAKGPTQVIDSPPGTFNARPGSYRLVGKADGYRPGKAEVELAKDGADTLKLELLPAKAALRAEKIEIKDSVYFETGKSVIKAESFPLLDEIAEILKDHPELTKIRIEGHTDSRGKDSDNLKLSQGRADSVRTYLASRGVAPERLESIGYGETRPLVKEKGEADRAKNRRVDFFVGGRSDGAAGGAVKTIETKGDTPKAK